jgi:hypothetical protein
MRLAIAVPEEYVSPEILDAALEVNTRLNQAMIRSGAAPTFREALAGGGVQWAMEPPGEERFDNALEVLGRGWGDCDDIGPWEAASMRETGEDPGAKSRVVRSGPSTWHAIVQKSDGSLRDPSQDAGMTVSGIHGAVVPPMGDGRRPTIALMPRDGAWRARADLPWANSSAGASLVGYAARQNPVHAVSDAICGLCLVGETAGVAIRDHCANLLALEAVMRGVPVDQLQACFAQQGQTFSPQDAAVVGDLFSCLVDQIPGLVSIDHSARWGVGGPMLVRL